MDVVATRDIHPDEEIFIDYGEEWEAAWDAHVRNWQSPCQGGRLSSFAIAEMNKDKFNTLYHEWTVDHFTVCTIENSKAEKVVKISDSSELGNVDRKEATNEYEGIGLDDDGFKLSSVEANLRIPCKIRRGDPERRIFETTLFYHHRSEIEIHNSMPEADIDFIPKPYHSDMHFPEAFRHAIRIPDDIFPQHWIDLLPN